LAQPITKCPIGALVRRKLHRVHAIEFAEILLRPRLVIFCWYLKLPVIFPTYLSGVIHNVPKFSNPLLGVPPLIISVISARVTVSQSL
jgi:hypothetical protein